MQQTKRIFNIYQNSFALLFFGKAEHIKFLDALKNEDSKKIIPLLSNYKFPESLYLKHFKALNKLDSLACEVYLDRQEYSEETLDRSLKESNLSSDIFKKMKKSFSKEYSENGIFFSELKKLTEDSDNELYRKRYDSNVNINKHGLHHIFSDKDFLAENVNLNESLLYSIYWDKHKNSDEKVNLIMAINSNQSYFGKIDDETILDSKIDLKQMLMNNRLYESSHLFVDYILDSIETLNTSEENENLIRHSLWRQTTSILSSTLRNQETNLDVLIKTIETICKNIENKFKLSEPYSNREKNFMLSEMLPPFIQKSVLSSSEIERIENMPGIKDEVLFTLSILKKESDSLLNFEEIGEKEMLILNRSPLKRDDLIELISTIPKAGSDKKTLLMMTLLSRQIIDSEILSIYQSLNVNLQLKSSCNSRIKAIYLNPFILDKKMLESENFKDHYQPNSDVSLIFENIHICRDNPYINPSYLVDLRRSKTDNEISNEKEIRTIEMGDDEEIDLSIMF
jgi:hypothetical protein